MEHKKIVFHQESVLQEEINGRFSTVNFNQQVIAIGTQQEQNDHMGNVQKKSI